MSKKPTPLILSLSEPKDHYENVEISCSHGYLWVGLTDEEGNGPCLFHLDPLDKTKKDKILKLKRIIDYVAGNLK